MALARGRGAHAKPWLPACPPPAKRCRACVRLTSQWKLPVSPLAGMKRIGGSFGSSAAGLSNIAGVGGAVDGTEAATATVGSRAWSGQDIHSAAPAVAAGSMTTDPRRACRHDETALGSGHAAAGLRASRPCCGRCVAHRSKAAAVGGGLLGLCRCTAASSQRQCRRRQGERQAILLPTGRRSLSGAGAW